MAHLAANISLSPQHSWLFAHTYTKSTIKSYTRGVAAFANWGTTHFPKILLDHTNIDKYLCMFVHDCANDGYPRSLAQMAVSGSVAFLNIPSNLLHYTHHALTGWRRLNPSKQHNPIPWQLALFFAIETLKSKHQYRMRMAVGMLVAWNGLLRKGELCNLRYEDVSEDDDSRLGIAEHKRHIIHLRLATTKTGANQSAIIDNPLVINLLRQVLKTTKPGQLLFPCYHPLSLMIHDICKQYDLPRYVFHGLRHGGATHMHRTGKSISFIKQRGRWKQERSCLHYIQHGTAALLQVKIPKRVNSLSRLYEIDTMNYFTLTQSHK
jgi:integrase